MLADQGVVLLRDQLLAGRAVVLDELGELLGVLVIEGLSGEYQVQFRPAMEDLPGVFEATSGSLPALVLDRDWLALGPFRAQVSGVSARRPAWVPAGVGWAGPG